jgi:methylmalonyl-CoA mutase N-terminal domain/subunit
VGHPAYRNREKGSFYIEELTETLHEEHSRKHLVDIITAVQGRVSNLVKGRFEVQMPEFISRLRGPLYLS